MVSGKMQASVTTTQGLERRLEVAVPGERVAGEVDQRLKRLARTARLKGFRPGKVPYAVVRQQFGSQVHAQTVSDLMQSTFAEAVSQHRLRPAGGPRIEPIAVEPGSELRYAAIFEVLPDVTLKPLDAIALDRPSAAVTDEDVATMIESMRTQRPIFTLVERAAQDGDRVTLEYEGRIDGAVFPGGKGEAMLVTIGAHRILTEIEQALVGMAAGDAKTIPAVFPRRTTAPRRWPARRRNSTSRSARSRSAACRPWTRNLRARLACRTAISSGSGARSGRAWNANSPRRSARGCASSCSMRCTATIRSTCRTACSRSRSASCRDRWRAAWARPIRSRCRGARRSRPARASASRWGCCSARLCAPRA